MMHDACTPTYRNGVHAVHASSLEHRVMGFLGGVQDAIWEVFTPNKDAVQVALSTAVGDVTPKIILVNFPKLGKPIEHANLCVAGLR